MSKGDHVYNNVVAKLQKSFAQGLLELRKAREQRSQQAIWRDHTTPQDAWLVKHMPRTWAALDHFLRHPQLVVMRNQLQTSDFMGDDINNAAYSSAASQFEREVMRFFRTLDGLKGAQSGNALLPEIAAVRRTFFHMTREAKDPLAQQRLLAQYASNQRARQQIVTQLDQVGDRMGWAWGQCEYLFRMTAAELLVLPQ